MAIWILLGGVFATGVCGVLAYQFQKRSLVLLTLAIIAATIAGVLIDQWIVTDDEKIKNLVRSLARSVGQNNIEESLSLVSAKAPLCRQAIQSEMPTYQFRTCMVVAFDEVRFAADNPREASLVFRVAVDLSATRDQYDGYATRDVKLFFRKEEDDEWRVVGYVHRTPSNQDWNGADEIGPGIEQ